MDFFKQLESLLPEGRATHFTVFKKGDQLTVSMAPAAIKGEKDLGIEPDEIKPLNITGSVAELDSQFFDIIKAPQERIVKSLTHNAAEVIASIDKSEKDTTSKPAKKATTAAPVKKVEPKEDSKKLIEEAAILMKEKKWKEALAILEKAKVIDPKNKYIDADIKTCNQWIKAMGDAGLFPEPTPVTPAQKKAAAPVVEEVAEEAEVAEEEPEEVEAIEEPAADDELDLPIDL